MATTGAWVVDTACSVAGWGFCKMCYASDISEAVVMIPAVASHITCLERLYIHGDTGMTVVIGTTPTDSPTIVSETFRILLDSTKGLLVHDLVFQRPIVFSAGLAVAIDASALGNISVIATGYQRIP